MHHFFLLGLLLLLSACKDVQSLQVRDGPYVSKGPKQWQALWVCDGLAKSYTFPPLIEPRVIEKCGLSAQLQVDPAKRPAISYPAVQKLAVLSDIHGQFDVMKRLLTANHITDDAGNWIFAKGHLVVVGDVFDRGDKVTEVLWLLYQLEQQALAVGGRVHLLLGNHEVMTLNGDLRYMHKQYQLVENVLDKSIPQLYGKDTVLGQWLQTRNVLVKIGDMLFAHGGFNPELAKQERSLAEINHIFTANLIEDKRFVREDFAKYLHKSDGLIWYRGYFRAPKATEQDIALLKSVYGVKHIIVGHTTQDQVVGLYDNAIIAVDSGIKRGQSGEILIVVEDRFYRGLLDGSRIPLN
ncbi:MAG: metallophosphoesterase [Paraglaciecola sp.]|nr:metallophosphoesterase [Paraglaciecola sp.]